MCPVSPLIQIVSALTICLVLLLTESDTYQHLCQPSATPLIFTVAVTHPQKRHTRLLHYFLHQRRARVDIPTSAISHQSSRSKDRP